MTFTFIAKGSTVKQLATNFQNFPDDSYLEDRLWYFYFDFSSPRTYCGFDRASGAPAYPYPILDLSTGIQPLLDLYPEIFL